MKIYPGETYLENGLDSITSHESTVDTFFHRTAHSDSAEVIKIEMAHIASRAGIIGRRD